MINFDDVTKENIKEHNPNQPQFSDHLINFLDLEKQSHYLM